MLYGFCDHHTFFIQMLLFLKGVKACMVEVNYFKYSYFPNL